MGHRIFSGGGSATRLRVLLNGQFVEHFEYDIAGTPCAPVVEAKKLVHIPDRLIELYPHDPDLLPIKAVSYLGVPLLDPRGDVMGHLSVLDIKPLPADPRQISLFEIFAARAAGEQRRLKQEMEVRVREEELSALLESAMDAVVVLDAAGVVARVNPAAALARQRLRSASVLALSITATRAEKRPFRVGVPGEWELWARDIFLPAEIARFCRTQNRVLPVSNAPQDAGSAAGC